MNNITYKFKEKEEQNRKTNIAYIVAGYPSIDFTKELLLNLDRTLIDVLEIGIPYSDPLADGKLISKASFAATENGVTTQFVQFLGRPSYSGAPRGTGKWVPRKDVEKL